MLRWAWSGVIAGRWCWVSGWGVGAGAVGQPRARVVPQVSDLHGDAERKRLQREQKDLADKLRQAADVSCCC